MDDLSDHDAEETRKLSMEILSDDEETESEERGSSSDKTDIVADSPPTKPTEIPTSQPSNATKPRSPPPETSTQPISPPKDQPNIPPSNQEPGQPPKPLEEEPPVESQAQQPSAQEVPTGNVVASEATTAEAEGQQVKPPTRRMKVKHVMTRNPFDKKKKEAAAPEEEPEQVEKELEMQQSEEEDPKRTKLQVRKKQGARRGKLVAVSKDATTSEELEVENAQIHPAAAKEDDAADVAKKKEWEEAKQRPAANIAKDAQQAPPVLVASAEVSIGAIMFEDTAVTGAEEQARKKERQKKKGDKSSKPPTRQSGRLRSGVLNK